MFPEHRLFPMEYPRPHVLVVDDEPDVRLVVQRYFETNGFRVSGAGDGASARSALERDSIDLVLLDIGLPGEDGLALARHLREHWQGAVIIVSGHGDPVERVIGLEVGADDYVAKPFDLRELLARARSVLRRVSPAAIGNGEATGHVFEFDGMRFEPQARRLIGADGAEIELTTGEFDLLTVLLEQPNRALSRDQIMQRMHGRAAGPYDRAIDVQIGRLRQKIEPNPSHPTMIKSVRGVGYLFASTVRRR